MLHGRWLALLGVLIAGAALLPSAVAAAGRGPLAAGPAAADPRPPGFIGPVPLAMSVGAVPPPSGLGATVCSAGQPPPLSAFPAPPDASEPGAGGGGGYEQYSSRLITGFGDIREPWLPAQPTHVFAEEIERLAAASNELSPTALIGC